MFPALAGRFFATEPPEKPIHPLEEEYRKMRAKKMRAEADSSVYYDFGVIIPPAVQVSCI